MAKLAVNGGKAVRGKSAKWPVWPQHGADEVKLMTKIVKSDRWSYDGPYEWQFAKDFSAYHKSKFGMCNANGTIAIQLALEALGIGAHDEVIVPGMTWQATAAAALDINAIPVLVDVEPDTWCADVKKVEEAITSKTRAVIVVHLYGSMTDMTKLKSLCKKRNLYLIEDCAHQHGAFYKKTGVGAIGDIGCFSFQESKVLSAGEGGFNMCQDKTLFERLYSLRNCGRGYMDDMTNAVQSGNYRLTEFQAAMLIGALKRLDRQVKTRDANAIYLNSLLEQIPGVLPMRRRKEITQASYFNFAFRLDPAMLDEAGITNAQFCTALGAETQLGFEPPYEPLNHCHLYKPHTKPRYKIDKAHWKKVDPKRFSLPVSEDAHFKTGVSVHHHMLLAAKKDMEQVAEAVGKVVDNIGDLKSVERAKKKSYRKR